jgi:hypothetical protein
MKIRLKQILDKIDEKKEKILSYSIKTLLQDFRDFNLGLEGTSSLKSNNVLRTHIKYKINEALDRYVERWRKYHSHIEIQKKKDMLNDETYERFRHLLSVLYYDLFRKVYFQEEIQKKRKWKEEYANLKSNSQSFRKRFNQKMFDVVYWNEDNIFSQEELKKIDLTNLEKYLTKYIQEFKEKRMIDFYDYRSFDLSYDLSFFPSSFHTAPHNFVKNGKIYIKKVFKSRKEEIAKKYETLKRISDNSQLKRLYKKYINPSSQLEKLKSPIFNLKNTNKIMEFRKLYSNISSQLKEIEIEIKGNIQYLIKFNLYFLSNLWKNLSLDNKKKLIQLFNIREYGSYFLLKRDYKYYSDNYRSYISGSEYRKFKSLLEKYSQKIEEEGNTKFKKKYEKYFENVIIGDKGIKFWNNLPSNKRKKILSERIPSCFDYHILKWKELPHQIKKELKERIGKFKRQTLLLAYKRGNITNLMDWYYTFVYKRDSNFIQQLIQKRLEDNIFEFPLRMKKIRNKKWENLPDDFKSKIKGFLLEYYRFFRPYSYINLAKKISEKRTKEFNSEVSSLKKRLLQPFKELDGSVFRSMFQKSKKDLKNEIISDLSSLSRTFKDKLMLKLEDSYYYASDIYFAQDTIRFLKKRLKKRIIWAYISNILDSSLYKIIKKTFHSIRDRCILKFNQKESSIEFITFTETLMGVCKISSSDSENIKVFTNRFLFSKLNEDFYDLWQIADSVSNTSFLIQSFQIKAIQEFEDFPNFITKYTNLNKNPKIEKRRIRKFPKTEIENQVILTRSQFKKIYKDFSSSKVGKLIGRIGVNDQYLSDFRTELRFSDEEFQIYKYSKRNKFFQKHIFKKKDVKQLKIRNNNKSSLYFIDQFKWTFGGKGNILNSLLKSSSEISIFVCKNDLLLIKFQKKKGISYDIKFVFSSITLPKGTTKRRKKRRKKVKNYILNNITEDWKVITENIKDLNYKKHIPQELMNEFDFTLPKNVMKNTISLLKENPHLRKIKMGKEKLLKKFPTLLLANDFSKLRKRVDYLKKVSRLINFYKRYKEIIEFKGFNEKGINQIKKKIEQNQERLEGKIEDLEIKKEVIRTKLNSIRLRDKLIEKAMNDPYGLKEPHRSRFNGYRNMEQIKKLMIENHDDVLAYKDQINHISAKIDRYKWIIKDIKKNNRIKMLKTEIQSFLNKKPSNWDSREFGKFINIYIKDNDILTYFYKYMKILESLSSAERKEYKDLINSIKKIWQLYLPYESSSSLFNEKEDELKEKIDKLENKIKIK